MNTDIPDSPRDACVTMGVNDAPHCTRGWLPVEQLDGATVRWCAEAAWATLQAPPGATHVGVELFLPSSLRAPRAFAQLTVRDPWVGADPAFGPTTDVCFRLMPGHWQVLECPLPLAALERGGPVDIVLRVERLAPPWDRLAAPWMPRPQRAAGPRRAAVRRLWVRGDRLAAADVTIVVLNWKGADETIACLESLAAADLGGARVLVVDNGSRDGSPEAIRARFPDQTVLALPDNRGYAGGNNAGIAAALADGARAVLLLNNDTTVTPDFLRPLVWVMNSHARVAAVASSIVRQGRATLDVAWLDVYFGHGLVHRRGVNALPGEGFDQRREVEVAVGCSVLLSADALRAIGALDDAYFAYHEEVDWCFRARQAGWQIHYQPYSRVYHGSSKSTEALVRPLGLPRAEPGKPQLPNAVPLAWNPVRTYLGARNAVRFVRKHGRWWQQAYFALSTAYAVPLELLAVVLQGEEELMLGLWSYRRALALHLRGRTAAPAHRLATAATAPWRLLVGLPREVLRVHRDGRTAQLIEHCRGLWDGLRGRPLPLDRLGLR